MSTAKTITADELTGRPNRRRFLSCLGTRHAISAYTQRPGEPSANSHTYQKFFELLDSMIWYATSVAGRKEGSMASQARGKPDKVQYGSVSEHDSTANQQVDLTNNEIALRAYQLWEERGRPIGSPETDWFRAEVELQDPTHLRETAAYAKI